MTEIAMNYGGQLVGLFLVLAGLFGVYRKGKNDEAAKRTAAETATKAKAEVGEAKREVAEVRHEVQTIEGKSNVQAEVGRMPVGVAADRLRNDWSRD